MAEETVVGASETPVLESAPASVPAPAETAPVVAPSGDAAASAPAEAAVVAEPETQSPEAAAAEPAAETPATESPTAEEAAPVEAAEAPTYTAFTLPEGMAPDPERLSAFTELASKHALTQEVAQDLINLHTAELQRFAQDTQKALVDKQWDDFAKTRAGWRDDFAKQAGNRHDTILEDAKGAVALAIPNEDKRKAFWAAMEATGAGDHPDVINVFGTLGRKLRERAAPPNGLPPKTQPANPADRRYGTPRR